MSNTNNKFTYKIFFLGKQIIIIISEVLVFIYIKKMYAVLKLTEIITFKLIYIELGTQQIEKLFHCLKY